MKEEAIEFIGGKICAVCGVNSLPICCYDFHHDKGAKENNISKLLNIKTMLDEELKIELRKCVLVCANCHRIITHEKIKFIK